MKLDALRRLSLRRTLLVVLLPGMLLVVAAELWLTWRTVADAANAAYDRSLLGAIKSIDANISTESGGLAVELPYRMLEFFQLTANGQVYYRVATEDGLVEIGSTDLPAAPQHLVSAQPQFADAVYYGEPVRVGSYARALIPPIGDVSGEHPQAGRAGRPPRGYEQSGKATFAHEQRVVIQVAETLGSRDSFTRTLMLQAVQRDLLLIVLAGGLLTLAIGWALRPLAGLRDEVGARAAQDLSPVATTRVPADVRPLVEAINHHIKRNRELAEAQRRFIDDASHQLRTPLATLTTQVGFALREPDTVRLRDALAAVKAQLDETVRQTNQMLSLARADTAELSREDVDVLGLAEDVTRALWPAARERGIDLGFEPGCQALHLPAHAGLLKEALSNLIHNAIRYTPSGGKVTVYVDRAAGSVVIRVVDDGPGLAADELPRAGERFFRGRNAVLPGSGLGLAIVKSIAQRHGGSLHMACGEEGRGLVASITLPIEV